MNYRIFVCALLAATVVHAPVNAATYALRLFSTDDAMNVFITNGGHAESLILQDFFPGQSPTTFHDISGFVDDSGADNLLTLELTNGPAGYSYGYEFRINDVTVAFDQCGIFNIFGCDNNRYGSGLVKRIGITFSNAGVSNVDTITIAGTGGGAVPEPASWVMLVAGFGVLGAAARRQRAAFTG